MTVRESFRGVHADTVVIGRVRFLVDLDAVFRDPQRRPSVDRREELEEFRELRVVVEHASRARA